jgi:hypothetical protein
MTSDEMDRLIEKYQNIRRSQVGDDDPGIFDDFCFEFYTKDGSITVFSDELDILIASRKALNQSPKKRVKAK